jgi:transcription elongation GreA/GreB family factor
MCGSDISSWLRRCRKRLRRYPNASNILLRETLARDLRYWAVKKASAQVAPPPEGAAIAFGSRVTLTRNGKTQSFRIVGEDEADPARGSVSWRSPLAQAVMGAEEGDEIEMEKPKSEIAIVKVEN